METIRVERGQGRGQGVVTVTLDRPEKRNAINRQMSLELLETFREIAAQPADRVLVLTGDGGAFCSGADLSGGDGRDLHALVAMRSIGAVALALHGLPKPTIAKVRGAAAGAGCNMALACDLVVACEDARFTQIFVKRGMVVDFGGSWLLPRLIGMQRAKELAFFGDFVSATEARDLGLVNRVVPDTDVDAFVDEWAARLAAGPPLTLSMTKALLSHSFETSMEQALEEEARSQALCLTTDDTREAIKAFLEKRAPTFRGR
jgi:2-(1,2-epoxy-1,2-dihydrophenyl)acetyl-CoA isomerase